MSFSLTYDLEGAGWAMVQIKDGEMKFDATVSCLHDSLMGLGEAARALQEGEASARVVFMDEPGEIQLLLVGRDESLEYELRWFDDWNSWGMHPDNKFKSLHKGTTTIVRFVSEVRKKFEAVLSEYGESGYREKSIEHDFPTGLLRELQNQANTE